MALGFQATIQGSSTWVQPDKGLSAASTPRIKVAKFGDGYEQRKVKGINVLTQNYDISFNNRDHAEINDIEQFFVDQTGTTNFAFRVPDSNNSGVLTETEIKVVCDSWTKTHTYGEYYSLTAKFRRVYEA